ncbi:hypothetical protein GCM10011389_09340 [Pontibacillus salipaludis]|uniref:Uncharacterized protein n=1 Tax=Pontibacillus salipaludis TaxID=1697394 RepID=A0ABQ1PUE5_9BACI|nr:hypothetical protein GCM10011389_09340 [Pontibacillus salipaludis]
MLRDNLVAGAALYSTKANGNIFLNFAIYGLFLKGKDIGDKMQEGCYSCYNIYWC